MTSSYSLVTAAEVLMSPSSCGHSTISSITTTNWTPPLQTATVRSVPNVRNISSIGVDPLNESMPQANPEIYPCLHPINPHMRDSENRLQTFADRAANWPAHRINATPREIVEAGFYYLGELGLAKRNN